MIPQRFVVEYPQRCLELIDCLEPIARQRRLVGSFSLLAASSLFTIPYERLKVNHPLAQEEGDSDLYAALRRVERQKFLEAEFWISRPDSNWRFSRVVSRLEPSIQWKDQDGVHPMLEGATNTIAERDTKTVLRTIRNALAHGNVVYLDKNGFESPGEEVNYLAFLSRYEETEQQRQVSESYRVAIASEEEFWNFVKGWAVWLSKLPPDSRLSFDVAAE